MGQRSPSAVLFLDRYKAFETIDNHIILGKLGKDGLWNSAVSWIEFYLSNRAQQTKISDSESLMEYIICGVPWGSILRPQSFTIYMNDLLSSVIDAQRFLYADNTAMAVSIPNPNNRQKEFFDNLQSLASWFKKKSFQ